MPYGAFFLALLGTATRWLHHPELPEHFAGTISLNFGARQVTSFRLRQHHGPDLEDRALWLILKSRYRLSDDFTGSVTHELHVQHGTVTSVAATVDQSHKANPVDVAVAAAIDAVAIVRKPPPT